MATTKTAKKSVKKSTTKSPASGKNLVIVESPYKSHTIQKFLGSKYEVIATVGHVRDLPKSRLAVDINNNYEPDYIIVRGKADIVKDLKKAAKNAKHVYLATDPDREGEAISWHLCNILDIDPSSADRIEFNEITEPAIKKAVTSPRPIDMNLVDAQQGRRVIDRLVGFQISPLLWNKVGKGLSAGRVQSAALKMVCDREREIQAFVPKEYWVVQSELTQLGLTPAKEKKSSFIAKLEQYKGKKLTISDEAQCNSVIEQIKDGQYEVVSVVKKKETKKPYAPYTTSTLMQDASHKLGFGPEKTRKIAQQLYEGVNIKGHGTIGLITYIRTDSVRISAEADAACKAFIKSNFSADYVGNNFYTNKNGNTQDAHEAIRPSYVDITPEEAEASLDNDQFKLYKLIWSRFVASRMKAAVYDSVLADIKNGDYTFKANGKQLVYDGYLKVYKDNADEKEIHLPELNEGEALKELSINQEQKFTEPPSRFTEASLIKELEDKGIGRPSTYASIVSTLEVRKYIKKIRKAIAPTDLGTRVNDTVMEVFFKEIVDAGFTAGMEDSLDKVAEGKAQWRDIVGDYYNQYVKEQLDKAIIELEKYRKPDVVSDEICPECGKPLLIKDGRFGQFLACSGFPDCKFTKAIVRGTGVKCPKCGSEIIVKRSKKGKTFYGCSGYPKCDQVFWYKPVDKVCPKCGSLLTERGKSLVCSNDSCGYKEKK